MRIFVDLDEVLRDFTGAVFDKVGITKKDFLAMHPEGEWDFLSTFKHWGFTPEQVWEKLDDEFWLGIKPHPLAVKMLEVLELSFGKENVFILTAGTGDSGCNHTIATWLELNGLGRFCSEGRIHISKDKASFVRNRYDVLIDDSPENCKKWEEKGGSFSLYETYFNRLNNNLYPRTRNWGWIFGSLLDLQFREVVALSPIPLTELTSIKFQWESLHDR